MRRRAPDAAAALGVICLVTLVLLLFSNRSLPGAPGDAAFIVLLACGMGASGSIGWLILRRTGNLMGWIFLTFSVAGVLWAASGEYLVHSFGVGHLPANTFIAVLANLLAEAMVLPLALVCLLFPAGTLPSRRWRPAGWAFAVGAMALVAWNVIRPGEIWGAQDRVAGHVLGPFSVAPWIASALLTIGVLTGLGVGLSGVVSLVIRARRSSGEQRQQIRWLMLVGAMIAGLLVFNIVFHLVLAPFGLDHEGWVDAIGNGTFFLVVLLIAIGMPAAVAIGILKYRLYDIDMVIRKTVVFGLLAAFVTFVYVAVVVGVGSLVGTHSDSLTLSIGATAIVAVGFQRVRERVQRFANRVVFGERATPYEVLARFSDRVGSTFANEDIVPRIARVIAEGTAAERAEVWLHLGDELQLAASWPAGEPTAPLPVDANVLPAIEADRAVAVRLRGELLGAIAVTKPRSEPLRPEESALLDRLAEQSALVLSNVRLTADLEARLEQIARRAGELRESRQRIVAAQDEERRRLERNIHDGAQQHLVALAVKLRLVQAALGKDAERAAAMLGELRTQVDEALDTIDALSLGIYPPLLEEQGIAAALVAQYTRTGLPVHLEADGVGRHPVELEAAIYFCVLEALQNAAKHARASRIGIRLEERAGALTFEVTDDGVGFRTGPNGSGTGLQGMRDRLAVFGGDVQVISEPGMGTTAWGRIPVPARTVAP